MFFDGKNIDKEFFTDPENNEFFYCDCTTLYEGLTCDQKRDFCEEAFQPCLNGATCESIDSLAVSWIYIVNDMSSL